MNMPARKINASWWVDFRFNGIRHRKKSPENSKAGAQAYEGVLRARLARGEEIEQAPPEKELYFSDFVWEWFNNYAEVNNKPSTVRAKSAIIRIHLLPVFGKLKLDEITSKRIERYKAQKQQEGLSNKSINNHLSVLRTCLTCAHDWQHLSKVPPLKRLKIAPSRFVFFTQEESMHLLRTAKGTRWYSMILCALHTGMRFGELCGLDWQDVYFDNDKITVRHSLVEGKLGSPKSNRIRTVPMTSQLRETLYQHKKARGFVFTYKGEPITNFVAYKALNEIYKKAGLQKAGWHALRHTFASTLVARGATMHSVQKLLGHSTIAMTERYAHLAPSSLNEAVSLLEEKKETFTEFWATGGQRQTENPTFVRFPGGDGGS